MSTIICDLHKGIMACDTQVTAGDRKIFYLEKIKVLEYKGRKYYWGFAGALSVIYAWEQWLHGVLSNIPEEHQDMDLVSILKSATAADKRTIFESLNGVPYDDTPEPQPFQKLNDEGVPDGDIEFVEIEPNYNDEKRGRLTYQIDIMLYDVEERKLYCIDSLIDIYHIDKDINDLYVIGSGTEVVMGVYEAGIKDPIRLLKYASRRDIYTGGKMIVHNMHRGTRKIVKE